MDIKGSTVDVKGSTVDVKGLTASSRLRRCSGGGEKFRKNSINLNSPVGKGVVMGLVPEASPAR
eukprot:302474-Pyramimonas_sp.AAC.1